jgi:predicted acylesterase/phospholipase RssA
MSTINGASNEFSWYPRVLIIGPGGIKGLKMLGFLAPIEDVGLLEYTDTFCGVSVGAIIALLIVAGYQIREIVGEASNLNLFKDIRNITFKSIIENCGLMSNDSVKRRLTQLMVHKFGLVPTLYNLYLQTGKAFVAVTLNATDNECIMMSPFTHPNISCVDVALFSINIPFIFYQLMFQGKTYVDGALGNPYPIEYFDTTTTNILGLYTKSNNTVHSIHSQEHTNDTDHLSPIEYSWKIINALIDQRTLEAVKNSSSVCKNICLSSEICDISLKLSYTITIEDKAHMLVEGFNEGQHFITSLRSNQESLSVIRIPDQYPYPRYYLIEPYEQAPIPNLIDTPNNNESSDEILKPL